VSKAQETLTTAQQTITSVREEIRPLIASANGIAEEASRAATLATAQVHKVDRLVSDLTARVDETSALVQQAIITPAREGLAIMAAVRATLGAIRAGADWRRRTTGAPSTLEVAPCPRMLVPVAVLPFFPSASHCSSGLRWRPPRTANPPLPPNSSLRCSIG
jgi:hypothetical protein